MMWCGVYRYLISWSMDSDEPLSALAARHVTACPDCRRFAESCGMLGRRLAEEAAAREVSVSPELHARIVRGAITRGAPVRRIVWVRPVLGALAVAALLMLGVGAAWYATHLVRVQSPPIQVIRNTPPTLVDDSAQMASESAQAIQDALYSPYDEEMDLLLNKGKEAAQFLLACATLHADLETK